MFKELICEWRVCLMFSSIVSMLYILSTMNNFDEKKKMFSERRKSRRKYFWAVYRDLCDSVVVVARSSLPCASK